MNKMEDFKMIVSVLFRLAMAYVIIPVCLASIYAGLLEVELTTKLMWVAIVARISVEYVLSIAGEAWHGQKHSSEK